MLEDKINNGDENQLELFRNIGTWLTEEEIKSKSCISLVTNEEYLKKHHDNKDQKQKYRPVYYYDTPSGPRFSASRKREIIVLWYQQNLGKTPENLYQRNGKRVPARQIHAIFKSMERKYGLLYITPFDDYV